MLFQTPDRKKQDARLVKAMLNANEAAFRELLQQYQPKIYRFASRFLGNSEEAKDIAQETFLKFFRSLESFKKDASLGPYLFMIARNLCIDFMRKKKPEMLNDHRDAIEYQTPLELLSRKEDSERIMKEILSLPERQRTAIDLRYAEGFTYVEIAQIMELSIAAIESLLVRGRKALRNRLSELNN